MAKLKPGETAPDFNLPAAAGGRVHLKEVLTATPATVVMFICNHCPYVQAYIPRIIHMQRELAGPGSPGNPGGVGKAPAARFIGICSNDEQAYPLDSFASMKKYAIDWDLNFAYGRDEDQSVAKAYGAERTPEIFVLDSAGVCRYEGGIDDNYQDPAKVTRRPLRDAILALNHGEPVKEPWTHAIGCTIKWKK